LKVVILAGGLGTRLAEETDKIPKPMVEVGGRPILWHIMKLFSFYGHHEFIICLGYKGYVIKEFFANYMLHQSNVTIDLVKNELTVHDSMSEPWKIYLVDTGLQTMTGGRLKSVKNLLGDESFFFTYGDGVGDIDLDSLVAFHQAQGKLATVTSVRPPGRYGVLDIGGDGRVRQFVEKPDGEMGWINGGFFVLEPGCLDYIESQDSVWEDAPLKSLVEDDQLCAFKHYGFWQPMDTLRDKRQLEELWMKGCPPWKMW